MNDWHKRSAVTNDDDQLPICGYYDNLASIRRTDCFFFPLFLIAHWMFFSLLGSVFMFSNMHCRAYQTTESFIADEIIVASPRLLFRFACCNYLLITRILKAKYDFCSLLFGLFTARVSKCC